jgi:signal transduction histidine kinase/putative methionine-R-sulfoxide reductase with GAF domain
MLESIAMAGMDDSIAEKYAKVGQDDFFPASDALRRNEALWFPSARALSIEYPDLKTDIERTGYEGWAVLPLNYEGRAIGTLTLIFAEMRQFEAEERDFLQAIAGQCAQALERAQVYELQRRAREAAEQASERVRQLQAITAALAQSITPQEVAQVIIGQGLRALRARTGSAALLVDADTFEMVGTIGYTDELREAWSRFPLSSPVLIAEAVRRGEPVLVESRLALNERHPDLKLILSGNESWAALPLVVEGRVIGGMVLGFGTETRFAREDVEFLLAIARQCAQALERTRRYTFEQEARAAAERAQGRLAFLAESSAVLGCSLEYEETLRNVAKLAVPRFADWCAVHLLEDDEFSRVALEWADDAKMGIREIRERHAPMLTDDTVRNVVKSGKSVFYPRIPESLTVGRPGNEEHARLLRELNISSGMVVPLRAHDHVLGAITFISADANRQYSDDDLALAEDLAQRAGMAIEHARLYRESRRIQEELRKANEAKDEFLGMVSHEMRTSITTIFGGASVLRARGDSLDEQTKSEVLADIQEDAEHLHDIIFDMFTLARVELGQKTSTEPVLAQRIIEKVTASFLESRPYRQIEVSADAELPSVEAEPTYLAQVLRNLLSNADKYSPTSAPIEIVAKPVDEGEVMISVLDRGRGIPAEETERIFERFYRASQSAGVGGTGIGLTVCKRLIEAQSGRIWAAPREGGGLEVSFTLPTYREAVIP